MKFTVIHLLSSSRDPSEEFATAKYCLWYREFVSQWTYVIVGEVHFWTAAFWSRTSIPSLGTLCLQRNDMHSYPLGWGDRASWKWREHRSIIVYVCPNPMLTSLRQLLILYHPFQLRIDMKYAVSTLLVNVMHLRSVTNADYGFD